MSNRKNTALDRLREARANLPELERKAEAAALMSELNSQSPSTTRTLSVVTIIGTLAGAAIGAMSDGVSTQQGLAIGAIMGGLLNFAALRAGAAKSQMTPAGHHAAVAAAALAVLCALGLPLFGAAAVIINGLFALGVGYFAGGDPLSAEHMQRQVRKVEAAIAREREGHTSKILALREEVLNEVDALTAATEPDQTNAAVPAE